MFFLVLLGAAVIALLGVAVCTVAIALEARAVPDLPPNMRLNPLNILSDRTLWTSQIAFLHRVAVRLGAFFLVALLAAVAVRIFGPQ